MFYFVGDANEPYLCTILINKISYGQAGSANKRQAKQLAGKFLCRLVYTSVIVQCIFGGAYMWNILNYCYENANVGILSL